MTTDRLVTTVGAPTTSRADAAPVGEEPILEASGVSKVFAARGVQALDSIDLVLKPGQFASIIGPSGCGKSTLLKIMAGLVAPTGGRVILQGTPVLEPRRDIGIMFQQATLLPWRTTIENVLLPIEIRDGSRAANARRDAVRALLDLVGLTNFEKVYPHELSGGMAQRVAICRMLVTEPAVLLLDEPFGALDELTREYMNVELQRVCLQKQATAFMVTHSIPEAVFLADVVYVMTPRPGRIAEVVPVNLPRPRTLDMMTEPSFAEVVRRVRSGLDRGGHG